MNQNKIVNLLKRALGSTGTKLKKEDELKTLYTWYINEIDQDGNVVKKLLEKFIPYRWRISFKIKNIKHVHDSLEDCKIILHSLKIPLRDFVLILVFLKFYKPKAFVINNV